MRLSALLLWGPALCNVDKHVSELDLSCHSYEEPKQVGLSWVQIQELFTTYVQAPGCVLPECPGGYDLDQLLHVMRFTLDPNCYIGTVTPSPATHAIWAGLKAGECIRHFV